ncbi:MAG: two-component system NarL family sensor histidine kinase DegS [Anaerolineaceae bacterium]|nr:MAG: two-component system NarL family sensor histidine kinase DegS [Anaerolineaceae bacterium]
MPLIEGTKSASADPLQSIQSELDETYRGLKEINLMLEQSRVEVNKLTQRNAAITAHLQQIQGNLAQMPAEEVRLAYDSALDAQQRLFVMRGQLEKLQGDQSHLERYKANLERLRDTFSASGNGGAAKEKGALASVEMLVNAQEAERQRLSRQMHDGPAQALSNFILQTEIAMRLLDVDAEQARTELGNLKAAAMSTFQKVRNFIFELRPMMLDDLGLVPTIRRYAETFKEQAGMELNVTVTGNERRMEPYLEVLVFRAMQELLGNSARYSQASLVKIQVDMGDSVVKLNVDDNGKGFDPEAIGKEHGLGLKLIKERVELLGGNFEIDSVPGKGARVMLAVPARTGS